MWRNESGAVLLPSSQESRACTLAQHRPGFSQLAASPSIQKAILFVKDPRAGVPDKGAAEESGGVSSPPSTRTAGCQ